MRNAAEYDILMLLSRNEKINQSTEWRISWIQKRTVIPWNGPRQWNLRSRPDCEPLDSEPCDICSGAEISELQLKDSGTAVEERCDSARRAWLPAMTQIHTSRFTFAYTVKSTVKSDHHNCCTCWTRCMLQWLKQDTAALFKPLFCGTTTDLFKTSITSFS